jgi:hypothetical protein
MKPSEALRLESVVERAKKLGVATVPVSKRLPTMQRNDHV